MSFSVSDFSIAVEWGSISICSFVGQLNNLLSLWWWRLIFDIRRFDICATEILTEKPDWQHHLRSIPLYRIGEDDVADELIYPSCRLESIGEYLKRKGYSEQFKKNYIIPMVAAPWCIDPDDLSRTSPQLR